MSCRIAITCSSWLNWASCETNCVRSMGFSGSWFLICVTSNWRNISVLGALRVAALEAACVSAPLAAPKSPLIADAIRISLFSCKSVFHVLHPLRECLLPMLLLILLFLVAPRRPVLRAVVGRVLRRSALLRFRGRTDGGHDPTRPPPLDAMPFVFHAADQLRQILPHGFGKIRIARANGDMQFTQTLREPDFHTFLICLVKLDRDGSQRVRPGGPLGHCRR